VAVSNRVVLYELDKERLLGAEEIGPVKQQRYSTGVLACDFMAGKHGSSVMFKQRLRLTTWIETKKDGHRTMRGLQDSFQDDVLASFHFQSIYTERPDNWSCTMITLGEALAKDHLVGSSAQRAIWDILWWCLHKRWRLVGKRIARAYPEWWELVSEAQPSLAKRKI
jgi:hypothetical protein